MQHEPVQGGFNQVAFYEVYLDGAERRRACKGAKGRQPTGKARYYILVDYRTFGYPRPRCYDAYGPFTLPDIYRRDDTPPNADHEPGSEPGEIDHFAFSARDAFAVNVRRVGYRYMPQAWRNALLNAGYFKVVGGRLYDEIV